MGVAQKIKITLIWENGTEEEINPNHIKDLRITKKLNDHVKLFFCGGRIEVNEKEDFLSRTNGETRVKVTYTGENSEPALIFAGVATRIKLWFVPGENYYYIKLNGSSETYWLGLVRRRRSFQNKEMPYEKALDKIAQGCWTAVISAGKELMEKNSKESKKLGQFTLQYQETDWQFLKRLASRFQTGLVPDPIATKPSLCVGLPEGKEYSINEPHILWIKKRIDKHRVIEVNYDKTSIPEEYVYYKLRTDQFLDIGDTVTLPGIQPSLYVYLSKAYILGSEFYFEAVVTPYGGLRQKPRYNRQLPGVTLEGYVIDVGGPDDDPLKDKVKVRINFDDPTPPEEAAWLPYATYYSAENHTGFYCLPELGDYVKMRFSSTDEDKSIVVSSTRLERDREKLVDHLNTKMFRTNHRKELALTQTGITLSGKEANLLIRLDQDKGVTISSHNELEIRSKGNLNLQAGRKVLISAKKAVDIKCGQSKVVLNENEKSGMIHIFGSKVRKEQGAAVASNIQFKENAAKEVGSEEKPRKTGELYIVNSPSFPWYINEKAEMPDGVLTAKWKNFKGKTKYSWDVTIGFDITVHYPKVLTLKDSDDSEWEKRDGMLGTRDITHHFTLDTISPTLKLQDLLKEKKISYCGDDIIVKVSAMAKGKKYNDELEGRILGRNPSTNDASKYLEEELEELFKKVKKEHSDFPLIKEDAKIIRTVLFGNESSSHHFHEKSKSLIGLPLYGPPDGWGIMQVDPPEKEEAIWSWKENMKVAISRINTGYIDNIYKIENFKQLKDHPMTRWQWRMLLYRRYNGGWFWKWNEEDKCWQWTRFDKYAYCLKAIRIEKKEFNIDIDSDYKADIKEDKESLVDSLRAYAKKNWTKWYGDKYPEQYFKF